MKIVIDEKPLSVNEAWRGRRFKSKKYTYYEQVMLLRLPKKEMIKGLVKITYTFYLKTHARTDYDNLLKPLGDILVKKGYIEDDRKIYEAHIYKKQSEEDRIEIEILPLTG